MAKEKPGKLNLLARPLGVELEYSVVKGFLEAMDKVRLDEARAWEWEHDGTLTKGGKELVCYPASGDGFLKMIAKIVEMQQIWEPQVDKSCGFHVHVQAKDLKMVDLRRLIALWCRVEKYLYGTLVKLERAYSREDGRHYCRPIAVTGDVRVESWQFTETDVLRLMRKRLLEVNTLSTTTPEDRIRAFLLKKLYGLDWSQVIKPIAAIEPPKKGEENYLQKYQTWQAYLLKLDQLDRIKSQFNAIKAYKRTNHGEGGCRYAAMNVHAYFYTGKTPTIEFRLKEGTMEAEELIFWPLFCGWFVESATRLDDNEVLAVHSLRDWIAAVRGFAQGSVLDWVEEKLEKKKEKCE